MPNTFFVLLFALTTFGSVFVPGASAENRATTLSKALDHLRESEFSTEYEKTIHDLLDRTVPSSGDMYFSKGKMRIEQEKPDKTLLIYDGAVAWQEQKFEGDAKPYVTKTKNVQKSSALLGALLGKQNILKNFLLKKETKNGKGRYDLVPKNPKINEVKVLRIEFDGSDLKTIAYKDNLDNEVTFKFSHFREKKISDSKFQYEPPKGSTVTEL